jgi:biopolymer transport protein ExbD
MAMNVGSPGGGGDPDVMVDINTTPLIDVMLVLLIMLIITIPIQTHAVKLNMPTNQAAAPPTPPVVVNIDVDFDGTITWDGLVVPDKNTLESKFQQIARLEDQPEVHLRPNKLVTYKYVALVMASAQRLGVTKIGLVGNEQFVQ